MEPLSPSRARFVAEYLVDLNATQAAMRAGYSRRTAKSQGSRLLRCPEVLAAIGDAKLERSERVEVTQDDVIRGLSRIAFAAPGACKDSDRTRALELLGKHLAMFKDVITDDRGPTLEEMVLDAQRIREDRDRKDGLNPYTHRPLQPGEQGYAENEAAAKAAQAAHDAEHGGAPRPVPLSPEPASAPAAEPSEPEIDAQPDPAPGRFNPLRYLRGGDA